MEKNLRSELYAEKEYVGAKSSGEEAEYGEGPEFLEWRTFEVSFFSEEGGFLLTGNGSEH